MMMIVACRLFWQRNCCLLRTHGTLKPVSSQGVRRFLFLVAVLSVCLLDKRVS